MRNNYELAPGTHSAADQIKVQLAAASEELGTASPIPYVGKLLDRSFPLPPRDPEYAANALTPGAVPYEPSFCECEPHVLRFTIVPSGPGSTAGSRRDEATREMRRLVEPCFGRDALRWFDRRSEEWRGVQGHARMNFGAYFGTAFDAEGLFASKVYYELKPNQLDTLPGLLKVLSEMATDAVPGLIPAFTSIRCGRGAGKQRVSFYHRGPLRLAALGPLMERLGMGHQLPGLMQVIGISLGGRFDLPEKSVLLGLSESGQGPELKLEVLLGAIPDVPPDFLYLLRLALSERPRELSALGRWLHAFTPRGHHHQHRPHLESPGEFSVLSIRTTPQTGARVSLYLRPADQIVRRRPVPNDDAFAHDALQFA